MLRTLLPLILILCLIHSVSGQKSKVTSGSMAVNSGDYEKAISLLDEALSKPDLLENKDKAKAWFKKGQSYRGLLLQQDSSVLSKYPNAAFEAIDAYVQSEIFDEYKTFAKERESDLQIMGNIMFQRGVGLYQNAARQLGENPEIANTLIDQSIRHLKKADELQANSSSILSVLGLAYVLKQDLVSAESVLAKSIALYESRKDIAYKDNNMLYAYKDLAEIYFFSTKESEKGMEVIEKAKKEFPDTKEFENLELNYYLQGDNIELGIKKFEDAIAIKENSESEEIHVAYASLLEKKGDIEAAAAIYERVLKFKPNSFLANYNIGAMYVNQAVDFANKANETDDINLSIEYSGKKEEFFKKSLPYMETAYKADMNDIYTVNALAQIYLQLNMMEESAKFTELKKKMQEN